MNDTFSPKSDGYIYKRRKLHSNIVALMSEENTTEVSRGSALFHSAIGSEDYPFSLQNDDFEGSPILYIGDCSSDLYKKRASSSVVRSDIDIACLQSIPSSVSNNTGPVKKEGSAEASRCNFYKSVSQQYSGSSDSYSLLRSNSGHDSAFNRVEVEVGECSSADIVTANPVGEFSSVKELCISWLKSHGLLGGACNSSEFTSLEVLGDDNPRSFHSCKICGIAENALRMLICDLCDEAFHVSCCNPKVKRLPVDEWYCQSCSCKVPKPSIFGRLHSAMPENGDGGRIKFMLQENQPYSSRVRVGYDFQVEVPQWCGPISDDDDDYFAEPAKLDPAECSSLIGCDKPSKSSTIGNWIQCREIIYRDSDDDEGTVCGKWRRVPLFVDQNNDWDCSCSVLWDPIHADCAVPQEMETDEILRHLKLIETLRPRLAGKQPANQQG